MLQHFVVVTIATFMLAGCAGTRSASGPGASGPGESTPGGASEEKTATVSGGEGAAGNQFKLQDSKNSKTAGEAKGAKPSKIKPSRTEAAVKFIVVDKDKGVVGGVVVKLTAPDGKTYYTEETDTEGYAEV